MNRSIERNDLFFTWVVVILLAMSGNATAQAPFYVSPKSCIQDPGTSSGGGSGMPTGACDSPTTFFDTDITSTVRQWDMGDGMGMQLIDRKVSYQYTRPGTYTATLYRVTPTGSQTVTRNVTVGNYPNPPLFNKKNKTDTTVCAGSSLKLNPYELQLPPSNVKYLWFPTGDTTRTITVDSSGCYSVEVMDKTTGCSRTAVINVKFCLKPAASGGGAESWYFGKGAAIEFAFGGKMESAVDTLSNEGTVFGDDSTLVDGGYMPVEANGSNKVNTPGSTAMVYGPDGSLKFYTDGRQIYTGDDEAVTDTSGVAVQLNLEPTTQGLAIIPKSACNECPHHQYYVFSVNKTTQMLEYSVIDMRYNNRQGAVVEANVPVMYPAAERISVTLTADSTGYLLLSHEANTANFTFIKVDSSGVLQQTQAIGSSFDATNQSGYMTVSPNGRSVAVGVINGGRNYVELYVLDKQTASLRLDKIIDMGVAPPNIYGLAFSNSSDILYVTLQGDGNGINSELYQLPLFVGDGAAVANVKTLIDSSPTLKFGALQLGPVNADGGKYVYMAIDGAKELPYIQQPDLRGGAAVIGYTRISATNVGIKIPGVSGLGFPNVIFANQQQDGDGITATYEGTCFGFPTVLAIEEVCNPMENDIEWIFPDGSSKKGKKVSYTFPKPGWNKVQVHIQTFSQTQVSKVVDNKIVNEILKTKCGDTLITDNIFIRPSPQISVPDSAYICTKDNPKTYITINPRPTGGNTFLYNWQTGQGSTIAGTDEQTAEYEVKALGNYAVKVTNDYGCFTRKPFKIIDKCRPSLLVPSAITPNGSGPKDNESLIVIQKYITDYHLMIFDRWGELIFESFDPDIRWDGTSKRQLNKSKPGTPVDSPMVYAYVIQYKSLDFPEWGILQERGTVTVLR